MQGSWSEEWVDTGFDIDFLKREVGKRFPFYDMRVSPSNVAFYCNIDENRVEELFDSLRRSLSTRDYIPTLRYENGEYILYILKHPSKKEKPIWVNIVLLIATIITTLLTGSLLDMGYSDLQSVPNMYEVFSPRHLLNGALFFSLPLMSILFVHEMGHYYASRMHGIRTSLPFFIPVPPILPGFNIGTFGALISSRDPMPNRKALFDVGFSGPLAGFLVALPITAYGLVTSSLMPISQISAEGGIGLGDSPLFMFLSTILLDKPDGFVVVLNPIAF
ncbi:MAG TPA: site-2 protease family protein, partial [Thermoplasmatales archaeon]|nr:site-2 protease family protein [Thermoplasmatales archaeon]